MPLRLSQQLVMLTRAWNYMTPVPPTCFVRKNTMRLHEEITRFRADETVQLLDGRPELEVRDEQVALALGDERGDDLVVEDAVVGCRRGGVYASCCVLCSH